MELYEFIGIFCLFCGEELKKIDLLKELICKFTNNDTMLANLSDNSLLKIIRGTQSIGRKRARDIAKKGNINNFADYVNKITKEDDDVKLLMEKQFEKEYPEQFNQNKADYNFGALCGELFVYILQKTANPNYSDDLWEKSNTPSSRFQAVYKSSQISEERMTDFMSDSMPCVMEMDAQKSDVIKPGQIYRICTTFRLKSKFMKRASFLEVTFNCAGQSYSSFTSFGNWISASQANNYLVTGSEKLVAWIKFTETEEGKMAVNILALGEEV